MKAETINIINQYLKSSNYQIDRKTFALQLETHPEYPSFKSISDTLDYFKIENLIARIPKNALEQIPKPFITLYKSNNGLKLVLIKKHKGYILITYEDLKREKISITEFKKGWDNTIIVIENNSQNFNLHSSFKTVSIIILSTIIFLNLLFNSIEISIYVIISLIGLSISYFIIKEVLGIHNNKIEKICEAISKANSCNNVINDKRGNLFDIISLSDAPIIYFSINFISFVIIGFNFTLIFFISILSIFVVLFSIYYQKFIIKQWCTLCLIISTILLFQFIILIINFEKLNIDLPYISKYLLISFLVITIWLSIKSLLISNLKLAIIESDFLKFKRDKSLFQTLLNKDKLINNNIIPFENKITFGSENPSLAITAITNPLCGFCVESFQIYFKILETFPSVQINFIFNIPFENKNDLSTQIVITVLDIYLNKNKEKALIALNEWYKERAIEKWKNTYKLPLKREERIFSILKTQQNWLTVNNVHYTPITILETSYYPKQYNINDLLLFVNDILLEKEKS
ncbi:vitamin K epoxide reductase family protein [Flavobacterium sp. '19STA2R22 D10 B1']|uniref:vitamin K epoxide reductase family protein n=1 Tax=Flavobacterium aerium TaxID=3037261 RepID=UPI00278C7319|nr:vitamin K epoxide reductase family protein [Flavobacterium sp. '19STA2R22 D10 B1']